MTRQIRRKRICKRLHRECNIPGCSERFIVLHLRTKQIRFGTFGSKCKQIKITLSNPNVIRGKHHHFSPFCRFPDCRQLSLWVHEKDGERMRLGFFFTKCNKIELLGDERPRLATEQDILFALLCTDTNGNGKDEPY
jgi:hypothetical protein